MTENPAKSAPRRHRRGLTRSVAACQRCRRRKQKVCICRPIGLLRIDKSQCDGKTPTCGPCVAAGATCIMSDQSSTRDMHSVTAIRCVLAKLLLNRNMKISITHISSPMPNSGRIPNLLLPLLPGLPLQIPTPIKMKGISPQRRPGWKLD